MQSYKPSQEDTFGGGVIDLSKFYDRVGVGWLRKAAQHLNFPRTALILGLEVMLSYRFIMIDNQIEEIGLAGNGIAAGDPLAISFARAFLYPAL